MSRDDALRSIAMIAAKMDAVVFVGNGYNARALCALADSPRHFYMMGSMGACPTLAAGFALQAPMPVIAIEGDGNALMSLSGFPVVAYAAPRTFAHIVLDNGVFETTGCHRTLSPNVDFAALATATGYRSVYSVADEVSLVSALNGALEATGASFIHVRTGIVAGGDTHPRVPYHPREISQRFRDATSLQPSRTGG